MRFMNRYDIEHAYDRFGREATVLGEATRVLKAFQEDVDAHSDGWPYWSAPVKAAAKLIALVEPHCKTWIVVLPEPTMADLRKALVPIKRFLTMRGRAAGMTVSVEPTMEVLRG